MYEISSNEGKTFDPLETLELFESIMKERNMVRPFMDRMTSKSNCAMSPVSHTPHLYQVCILMLMPWTSHITNTTCVIKLFPAT